MKKELLAGGRLDPQGLYGTFADVQDQNVLCCNSSSAFVLCLCSVAGSEKRTVELKNKLPANIVPNTAVERMLTINGEMREDVLVLSYRASTGSTCDSNVM